MQQQNQQLNQNQITNNQQQQPNVFSYGPDNINYYKGFKQRLTQKYGVLSKQKLFERLIDSKIRNRKLQNRLVQLEPFKQKNLKVPNQEKSARLFQQFQSHKFALKICYLGHSYDGMALQMQNQNTIEQYIFRCMHILNLIQTPRPKADYSRAGRTDKGVSAMGNVISLKLRTKNRKNNTNQQIKTQNNWTQQIVAKPQQHKNPFKQLNYCDMLNSVLPQDIRILACQPVGQQFNARYWCKQRSYKYFFVKNNLNIQLMRKAIKSYEGKHNFINFCKINLCNTVNFQRQIMKANIIKVENQYVDSKQGQKSKDDRLDVFYLHYVGNSFLWHQIRFMSSVLFMIGQGCQSIDIIQDLLNVERYPCKPNYPMASQYPLILQDCLYDELEFKTSPQTFFRFYNTFHQMIEHNTIEQTLITNCMHMAKRDLLANAKMTTQVFIQGVLQNYKRIHKSNQKPIEHHKAYGRGVQESIQSLKGKKKHLYEKKAKKQAEFEDKQKQRLKNLEVQPDMQENGDQNLQEQLKE